MHRIQPLFRLTYSPAPTQGVVEFKLFVCAGRDPPVRKRADRSAVRTRTQVTEWGFLVNSVDIRRDLAFASRHHRRHLKGSWFANIVWHKVVVIRFYLFTLVTIIFQRDFAIVFSSLSKGTLMSSSTHRRLPLPCHCHPASLAPVLSPCFHHHRHL